MFRLKGIELPDDCLGRSSRGVKELIHRNMVERFHIVNNLSTEFCCGRAGILYINGDMSRSVGILMRVSLAEKKAFQKAARKENQNVSDWIRSQLLSRVDIAALPPLSRFDDAIRSIQMVRKDFENWGNIKVTNPTGDGKPVELGLGEPCRVMVPIASAEAMNEILQPEGVITTGGLVKPTPDLNKITCCHCGKLAAECECKVKVDLGPPEGFVSAGENSRQLVPDVFCERCLQPGHVGEDCPIPMHMEGGKWVRD